jgi:flavin reductase (DIM6/NTAB) family NADH-FMN oxidoreductase RutF
MTDFRAIAPTELRDNPFQLIGEDWMLITAGTLDRWNTMTASWGGLGVLWSRPVAFAFIRPTRHTFGFVERSARFTLSFFGSEWRDALTLCGTKSGRDTDKAKATGLEPVAGPQDTVIFEQARLALVCRKLHAQDLDPARFVEPAIHAEYPKKDYHRVYVGEVEQCLVR